MTNTIIIGAGLTGLSCAYHLEKPYTIIEKNTGPGGLCKSIFKNGFTFDYSGHFLHIHKNETYQLLNEFLGGNLQKIFRNSWIYTYKTFVPYPFQVNLYPLPKKIKKECMDGFIKAKKTINNPSLGLPSFHDWSINVFGNGITKYFMKPYNEKLWSISSKELTADWVAPFVPQPSLEQVKQGAKNKYKHDIGYNASFYYPKHGGIQSLIDSFSKKINNLHLNTTSKVIDNGKRQIILSDGKKLDYKFIVSTQPLPELLKQITNLPDNVKEASKKLQWNSVTCYNIGYTKNNLTDPAINKHWIYFPEKKYSYYRVGFYSNIIKSAAPEDASSMYIEISSNKRNKVNPDKKLNNILSDLKKSKLIVKNTKPDVINQLDIPYAYVIYDKNRINALNTIFSFLETNNIYSIGRYGAWKYSFMEESIWDGKATAEKIMQKLK